MAGRRLTPDEAALWARVMVEVRPLRAVIAAPVQHPAAVPPPATAPVGLVDKLPARRMLRPPASAVVRVVPRPVQNTLDGSWDRRLSRGLVSPDRSVDLHGHTLASAYALLDEALERAVRGGDRVVLLVTGKPPRPESERPHARGAIRAAIGDWLAGSRHAGAIAAVRGAHPRHGGSGALYIVLRARRGEVG